MKKSLLALAFCLGLSASVFAQSVPPFRLQEIDGSPSVLSPTVIKVTNGTLNCSGKTCTITISASSGTVTSVSFTGGLISVANPTTTPAFTVAGTSGGIPYFSSSSTWASSAALAANALVIGGGAGVAPSTTTTGTGVVTALGVNVGGAGAFVVNGGALGTPASGTVTNLTGTASININGTVGATTPTTGAFTTVNGNTFTAGSYTLTGVAAKTLTFNDNITLASDGTGTRTLNVGAGGTLGSAAFVATGTSGGTIPLLNGNNTWSGTNTLGSGLLLATSPIFTTDITTPIVKTAAGTALALNATAPTATTGASQAGVATTITASAAVASTDTAGAAAGGALNLTTGAAARNTSGNAAGGNLVITLGAGIGTGNGGQLLVSDGGSSTCSFPQVSFVGATQSGICHVGSAVMFTANGNGAARAVSGVGLTVRSDYGYAFASDTSYTTNDLFLMRAGAASLRLGVADAAAPVAQTLSVQNVVGGTTDTAGANWTLNASRGTGTGAGGDLIIQTAPAAGSTASTQNTLAAAFTVKGNGAVQVKSVTFANLPTVANGYLIYCSDCNAASSPCSSGGSGALAVGQNSAWKCM